MMMMMVRFRVGDRARNGVVSLSHKVVADRISDTHTQNDVWRPAQPTRRVMNVFIRKSTVLGAHYSNKRSIPVYTHDRYYGAANVFCDCI